MLSETKFKTLKSELKTYTSQELVWFNGYLTGLIDAQLDRPETLAVTEVQLKPTIIYGTETGNAKKLAAQLLAMLKKNKIQAKVVDAALYDCAKLEKEEFIISIMSTQGEGEAPLTAIPFFESLKSNTLQLRNAKFAVLALGDSSYPLYCKAGEDLDLLLEERGAARFLPLQKADVDYTEVAEAWFQQLLHTLQNQKQNWTPLVQTAKKETATSIKRNYEGTLKHKIILNDRSANKETYHLEIVAHEDIDYEPGDAIGFYPKNKESDLKAIAQLLGAAQSWRDLENKNIKGLSKKSLAKFAALFQIEINESRLDLLDLLEKYGAEHKPNWDSILDLLRPIAPRLYSIASAKAAHDNEVHVTLGLNRFLFDEINKTGFCSDFLSSLAIGERVSFYILKNQNFRLPDADKDIIMIGPGTGIAPFRSFLSHRDANADEGRNWLFFGEQHFVSDFYYQTEIQEWLSTGLLNKLDTAFSRDQKHKIYVQDRLREQASSVFEWLQNGASLYICGQKSPMSEDVEDTLLAIIAAELRSDIKTAQQYLEQLEQEGRYQKDVY